MDDLENDSAGDANWRSSLFVSETLLIWSAIQVEYSSPVKKEEHGVAEEIRGDSKVWRTSCRVCRRIGLAPHSRPLLSDTCQEGKVKYCGILNQCRNG